MKNKKNEEERWRNYVIESSYGNGCMMILENLSNILKGHDIPYKAVYTHLGMSQRTWERRMKDYNFTIKEFIKITKLVNEIAYKISLERGKHRYAKFVQKGDL